jgi:phosphoribosyl 1,2-cyclic phosphodiesterase
VLRFCCLGSGSEGNALVVEAADGLRTTRVLLDNGFNGRQLRHRLARVGLGIEDLDAIVLTHEHSDHTGGVRGLLRQASLPVFCSAGTARSASLQAEFTEVVAGEIVAIGGALQLLPFSVAHDAAEPLQYVFSDGDRRLGVLTDVGAPGDDVFSALAGVDALLLECNHDAEMLRAGSYPPFLKARILGDRGHLSNAQAAALLQQLDRRRLSLVAAGHLSRRNNEPRLAQAALAAVIGCTSDDVLVADQDDGLPWLRC